MLLVGLSLCAGACGRASQSAEGDDGCLAGRDQILESGLQLVDLKCGRGEAAEGGAAATVNYVARLRDGTIIDSTNSGQPFRFLVGAGQVIDGWDEGIEGMREGGIRELHIPPQLAFGSTGAPPTVPPNAPLTFRVELVGVDRPPG
jgi:FKBP-type peptidyl-prolyl cis-trans isomerase